MIDLSLLALEKLEKAFASSLPRPVTFELLTFDDSVDMCAKPTAYACVYIMK